jgi:hypothetical protein
MSRTREWKKYDWEWLGNRELHPKSAQEILCIKCIFCVIGYVAMYMYDQRLKAKIITLQFCSYSVKGHKGWIVIDLMDPVGNGIQSVGQRRTSGYIRDGIMCLERVSIPCRSVTTVFVVFGCCGRSRISKKEGEGMPKSFWVTYAFMFVIYFYC